VDTNFIFGVAIATIGIVIGNLLLNGIKGNKKVSSETFNLFVEETRTNFKIINDRLAKIEGMLKDK
jgi:hypothetical protein